MVRSPESSLRSVEQADLYATDLSLRESAFSQLSYGLDNPGFIAEEGSAPQTARIGTLRQTVLDEWKQLITRGWGTVQRYMNLGTYGQAEIVAFEDSIGSGGNISQQIKPFELKVLLHVRNRLPAGHPLNELQRYNFYVPNIDVKENGLEGFIPNTEEMVKQMEKHNIHVYQGLARHKGYPENLWAALLADGDSCIRLAHYFGIDGGELLATPDVDGMQCLTVRFEYKQLKDDVLKGVLEKLKERLQKNPDPTNFILEEDAITIKYLTRAWWHMDSDVDALLWGANVRGLKAKDRDGRIVEFEALPDNGVIRNGGSYLDHLSATIKDGKVWSEWKGAVHGVDFNPETPGDFESLIRKNRDTAIGFGHMAIGAPLFAYDRDPRVLAQFPDTVQCYELRETLCQTGLIAPEYGGAAMRQIVTMLHQHPFHEMAQRRLAFNKENNDFAPFAEWLESKECDFYRTILRR